MNKRILSILLCLTLVASLLVLAIPVNAANSKEITVTADKETANPGDTITFTQTIGPVENMGAITTVISIPAGLTYVDGSLTNDKATINRINDFFDDFDVKPSLDASGDPVKEIIFVGAKSENVTTTESIDICTFQCTVDNDASGTITVGFDEAQFKMGDAEAEVSIKDQYTLKSVEITIGGETPTEAPTEAPTAAPHVHTIILVPEVAATTEADGVKAHYICSGCDMLFWDATGTIEITDPTELVIPKLDPTEAPTQAPSEDPTTVDPTTVDPTTIEDPTEDATTATDATVAPSQTPTKPVATPDSTKDSTKDSSTSPKTGDSTHTYLWMLIMIACLIGACAVVFTAKRKGIFTK